MTTLFSVSSLDRISPIIISMAEGCKLFVYGVSENVSREELEQEFGKCGTVTDAYNTLKVTDT